ncbi:cysteine hydrolase [Peteryoungia desertarenae]|uniref:Cysteine hydrolase n=1 Tax=Peteryoungia desertarenae TaxID=1813451 RepID=A0ABX6QIL8_9HYPH|nr:cysteine hydrolase [Peteryoungia desertarenae]QLF68411.1 cysteine hydrolase [Peteryoungia desertarenae]
MLGNWRHICVDMQRMFAEDTPWHVPWMRRALPDVVAIAEATTDQTVFTRFIPPATSEEAIGAWKRYYQKWWMMTLEHLPLDMLNLVPELVPCARCAPMIDKSVYSPWTQRQLQTLLQKWHVETLIITGGETDVCVMATILGAVDLGFHVIVVEDAVCSGVDDTHDASMELLKRRFTSQIQVLPTSDVLTILAEG